jgi:hypothetical protein
MGRQTEMMKSGLERKEDKKKFRAAAETPSSSL